MSIGGVSIILLLGLVNLLLLGFQVASGMHWIRVPVRVHRRTGLALVACGVLHGTLALLVRFL